MSVYRPGTNKSSISNYPNIRPTLDLDFANSKTLDPRITFTRSSGGSYVGADGLIKYAGVNEARFDHDPITGESLGLLMEESRTNLISSSNAWGGGFNVTWASGQISPTGGTEAYKMTETTANDIHGLQIGNGGYTANYNQYLTVFAKAAGRRYLSFWAALGSYPGIDSPECIFDLQTGTVASINTTLSASIFSSATIVNFGNGWYRCGVYLNPFALSNRALILLMSNSASYQSSSYTGDGSSGILLFGLQQESGASPSSYIPTVGSTRTRAMDIPAITGRNLSSFYNSNEGTFIYLKQNKKSATDGYYFGLCRSPGDFRSSLASARLNSTQIIVAGEYNIVNVYNLLNDGDDFKIAVTYNSDGRLNQYTKQSYSSAKGIFSRDHSRLTLGPSFPWEPSGGAGLTHCARFIYYPKELPKEQLQVLTR